MKTPVMNALKELVKEDSVSFHFPGHKGRLTNIDWAKLMPMIDTTETRGMDNLLEPTGIIKESQQEAAKVFGAKHTIYGVNGSTGSNYIALSAVANKGDKILLQRNCHKSVYNSMILNDLQPIYVFPNYNKEYELTTGVCPKEIERILDEHPEIKVVILTNPNYYGICSDIKTIAEIVHKDEKRILIVDEAHGPHIGLSDKYPDSAIISGADIVIHSTHKTLPSLTQTSLIHICSDRVDMNKLMDRYQLYTTTSPSYLFTLSNEMSVAYMAEEGKKDLDDNYEYLLDVRKRLGEIEGVTVLEMDPDDDTIFDLDICRITIDIDGYKGQELMSILYHDYNIRMEMSDYYNTLAVATVMNNKEDYETLIDAIKDIAGREKRKPIKDLTLDMPKPVVSMCPAEAYFAQKKLVNLEDSIGEVAATAIIPYPPGVPLLATGELITKEIFDYLIFLLDNNINIVNLSEDRKKIVVVDN
ncbi:MAG: aminotransferase class I/II-fold pyridoxal phosphate-dependent enzyme [Tissierellia bacterium]|jgi:arginine/lysine/ornithine decarboxylase|nr:aminotransferase class I/II-fold pyridoxal phosphate-dependent enzyme [Tissierellia bacterium]